MRVVPADPGSSRSPDPGKVPDQQRTAALRLAPRRIRDIPAGAGATRVELEHRNLERLGEQAAMIRDIFDSPAGWMGLLEAFARELGV